MGTNSRLGAYSNKYGMPLALGKSLGHLDKVDQSDYRKITIHFKKVGCMPISSSLKNNKLLEVQH